MNVGGAELMAEILTRLDKVTEGGIMAKLSERDQALADSIRALMFVFDDLIKLDDRGVQELMKEISKEDLPVALRGGSPEVKDKFLKNMSSRAAEMLREDMDNRGPVKITDVERAQQNILKVCRKPKKTVAWSLQAQAARGCCKWGDQPPFRNPRPPCRLPPRTSRQSAFSSSTTRNPSGIS